MSQSIGKLSTGRFHSDRFQRKVLRKLNAVPNDLDCPECKHGYDIVVSRRQVAGSIWSRLFTRHFHCRVCEHRFSIWNLELLQRAMRLTLMAAAFATLVLLPDWLP